MQAEGKGRLRSMNLVDIIVVIVVLAIIGAAVMYIRKEKKRGVRCVGCPSAGQCSGHCSGGCGGNEDEAYACHTDTK